MGVLLNRLKMDWKTDLNSLRHDAILQSRIDQRLQELTHISKPGTPSKFKSQRGGSVDVIVKNRITWPHEYVLAGQTKERVTYDQLSVTQWVAGFGRTIREESNADIRKHMLDYLIDIMDDANDFS